MIPFFNIDAENAPYAKKFTQELQLFMQSGQYILRDAVKTFEAQYAAFCGTNFCIGTSNGLDALRLIFEGYKELGLINKGDEVLVPAHTYIATILAVVHAGLKPVFIEPDATGFGMSLVEAKKHITSKTKACLVVHLYGELVTIEGFKAFAKQSNILLIEDAAQAHGAVSQNGQKAGAFGDAAAFSFYPAKNIGALGDAGAVTTNDVELAKIISSLRNYGSSEKYINEYIGFNMRMDALQARFLSIKLSNYPTAIKLRQQIASRYLIETKNPKIVLPTHPGDNSHVFHLFVVQVQKRNHFMDFMKKHGIQCLIHYPIPPHKQQALKTYEGLSLPITESYHDSVVSIPLYPSLSEADQRHIINVLNSY
ncbi:DegT/DnrJ/EryC1/StrS family aminotransferase [Flavobacteriaceae bacterium]|jgi:dTDP-4-amino-4,6-dideoxygalactose transaminase|nr:DegT/DnrJ/EryC1/StrS family aminotransferase [Flavobacteriaceae bacterium]